MEKWASKWLENAFSETYILKKKSGGGQTPYRFERSAFNVCFVSLGAPGVLGIWENGYLFFMELGSTGNYFQGIGEQAHSFGDLGSTAKKLKKNPYPKGKAFISFD